MSAERVAPLDTTAVIETPEHVAFEYRLAGPTRRLLAWLLDTAIRMVALLVLGLFFAMGSAASVLEGMSVGAMLVIAFALEWGYFVFFETVWSGRTPGKRAVGIRVVSASGTAVGFGDSLLRNLLRAADYLPSAYAIGLVVAAADDRFRRLGDRVADTIVVIEERLRVTHPVQLSRPPTPEELDALPAVPSLDGTDLEAIELLLRRAPALSPARAAELAEIVAPMYAARMSGLRYSDATRFLELLYHRAVRG